MSGSSPAPDMSDIPGITRSKGRKPRPIDAPEWWDHTGFNGPLVSESYIDGSNINSGDNFFMLPFDFGTHSHHDYLYMPDIPKPYYPAWHMMKGLRIARGLE